MSEEKPYSVFENQDDKVIVCGKRPVLFMNANLEKITDVLNKEIAPMIEALDEKNLKIMDLIERNAELEAFVKRVANTPYETVIAISEDGLSTIAGVNFELETVVSEAKKLIGKAE